MKNFNVDEFNTDDFVPAYGLHGNVYRKSGFWENCDATLRLINVKIKLTDGQKIVPKIEILFSPTMLSENNIKVGDKIQYRYSKSMPDIFGIKLTPEVGEHTSTITMASKSARSPHIRFKYDLEKHDFKCNEIPAALKLEAVKNGYLIFNRITE